MALLQQPSSLLEVLTVPAAVAAICALLWLLNKFLRRAGVKEHRVDRIGSGLLEMERLIRPKAEHVITARRQRKAALHNSDDDPPK